MGRVRAHQSAFGLRRLFRGRAHRDYHRNRRFLEYLFILPQWKTSDSILTPAQTGIPTQQLYDWNPNWTLNPNWGPWSDGQGRHHRMFTDAEERGISDYITNNYFNAGRLFTYTTFCEIAVHAYLEKHQRDEDIRQFNYSAGFITDFKGRNQFSSRRDHMKHRLRVTPQQRAAWIATLVQLLRDVTDHHRIVNVDESCGRVYPHVLQTWAPIGT
jgi:hypothetical protein